MTRQRMEHPEVQWREFTLKQRYGSSRSAELQNDYKLGGIHVTLKVEYRGGVPVSYGAAISMAGLSTTPQYSDDPIIALNKARQVLLDAAEAIR